MILNKFLLALMLAVLLIQPEVAQGKEPVNCDFETETVSNLKRTVRLNNFGISIQVPANFRAMSRVDGSVDFVDNGTYQMFNCLANNPGVLGGRGYYSIRVNKSKTNYLYANVFDKVPSKNNMFIVWKRDRQDENYTFHELSLRIKTHKGIIEIAQGDDEPVASEEEARENLKILLEIAEGIEVI